MSFIQREIDKIHRELLKPQSHEREKELHAAQQALSWATEPGGFRAPFLAIMGTQADSEDCLAHPHPLPSLDICSRPD